MNRLQNRKAQDLEKTFPGCLGRMMNLFDLNNAVSRNRLLTDKPHNDGSSLLRSQSDVARMMKASFGDPIEDKMIVSELRRGSSNRKTNVAPMKTLIAQEMSKDVESKHNPPNVVAKLMGLDTLPYQQPNSAAQRTHSKGYSRHSSSHSGILVESWEQDHCFLDQQMQCEGCQCREQNEYKDVYEMWQHHQKTNVRDSSPQKGRDNENIDDKKMSLIRQKFMEAQRLSTDENACQTQEFQDALGVLSTKRDLLLEILSERNSIFTQHLYDMQFIPPPAETKCITVLRPSKLVSDEKLAGPGKRGDKPTKKLAQIGQSAGWNKNHPVYSPTYANQRVDEYPAQPTRIVVLKPSTGKAHDIKAVTSTPSSSPRILHGEDFYDEPEDEEAQESREVAKEITQHMRGNLMGHRRDETLLSSVFSNDYVGDDSSFNKSENGYAVGNLSDSEIMSLASRHSWDYVNRLGSPYSSSSFGRASCSPESSVCREAKKRLSERWAMMASNGNSQDQKNSRRSSSTLGEMLALSDRKKSVRPEEEGTKNEQEPSGSTSSLTSNLNKEGVSDSPKSLLRSKYVPVSSTVYDAGLNVDTSEPDSGKTEVPKDLTKAKSTKSSLQGKVSSLFFSRNKKSSKEKTCSTRSKDVSSSTTLDIPGSPVPLPRKIGDTASQYNNDSGLEDSLMFFSSLQRSSSKTTFPHMFSEEGGLSVVKSVMPGNKIENLDQPSPISVLEPTFEEDDNTISDSSGMGKQACEETEMSLKSNLIDKSPPIESIARTLVWDDSFAETTTSYPLKSSSISVAEEEEQDWILYIRTLLSAAGFDDKMQSNTFSARWNSPDSPLDQSLRDKYANLNDKELLQEAKRRQRRSNRKLVFDSVNAALLDISVYGSDMSTRAMSCSGAHKIVIGGAAPMLVDHLWDQLKEWFCSEVRCTFGDGGDGNSLVVERVVKKEVVGKGWVDNMKAELDNLGKEIECKLLDELVEETVVNLTGRV